MFCVTRKTNPFDIFLADGRTGGGEQMASAGRSHETSLLPYWYIIPEQQQQQRRKTGLRAGHWWRGKVEPGHRAPSLLLLLLLLLLTKRAPAGDVLGARDQLFVFDERARSSTAGHVKSARDAAEDIIVLLSRRRRVRRRQRLRLRCDTPYSR